MKRTIGVFAHVDAGKTTFCEALLHESRQIRKPGRVDGKNTVMDHEMVEQQRGITVFSDIASFSWRDEEFYLIDTPGHGDFSAEMERCLAAIDAAVLIISGLDGVQSHTLLLFRMLKRRGLPVYFFINKADMDAADTAFCVDDIRRRLTEDCYWLSANSPERWLREGMTETIEQLGEWLADYDESVMEEYLEGALTVASVRETAARLVSAGKIHLILHGSALHGIGVSLLMDAVSGTLQPEHSEAEGFSARVFKVSRDEKGNRVAFIRCLSGRLAVKDTVSLQGAAAGEKVHEIRKYQGKTYQQVECIGPGDIAGVTGLSAVRAGMGLGTADHLPEPELRPALQAAVTWQDSSFETVMNALRKLEEQDPLLKVEYSQGLSEITISVMGAIQLEVLKALAEERYQLVLNFGVCAILYKETVASPVAGYGHYEPLRHYAEVHLRLEPNPGRGVEYTSECHPDRLARHHQNVILSMLAEKEHKGILTGSPLTDVKLVLTDGAVHEKHTEGGDLRQAAFRAVRQGLEKADAVLLEPYYIMEIQADEQHVGRVLSDITRLHGQFTPPVLEHGQVMIQAKGPAETFMDYPLELMAFTQGRGAVSMTFGGYEICHRSEAVIEEIGYEKERDLDNPSSSVFCAKGAGFEVKWREAEEMMHLL